MRTSTIPISSSDVLVAPTEPPTLRALGRTSSRPETLGCDYLLHSPVLGTVGVQRKEFKDLVASTYDGRLSKEFAQMKALGQGILLIEGRVQWTGDGLAVGKFSQYTMSQHLGMLWSAQLMGLWINYTGSMSETCELLSRLIKWTAKRQHGSIGYGARPNPKGMWGQPGDRDWGIHLLTSFQGIGEKVAGEIWDRFGGVPLGWKVAREELGKVPGLGKVRVEKLWKMLDD